MQKCWECGYSVIVLRSFILFDDCRRRGSYSDSVRSGPQIERCDNVIQNSQINQKAIKKTRIQSIKENQIEIV